MLTKPCIRKCGRDVTLPVEGGEKALALARGIPVMCEPCDAAAEAEDAARKAQERFQKLRQRSLLPAELSDLPFADMDREDRGEDRRSEAVAAAEAWAEGTFSGLLICGPVGTGKSRLAATAIWRRMERDVGVRWMSVPRLIVMANAGFGTDEKREATQVLTGKGGLALDDLDKVPMTEAVRSLLYVAIDNRYQAGTPLIVTTNLRPTEIAEQVGEAIASRLLGYCKVVYLTGRDRRLG